MAVSVGVAVSGAGTGVGVGAGAGAGVGPGGAEAAALKARERREKIRPLTKIVCRRLPPTMTEESFMEQVAPIPEHDYFYFSKPDPSLAPDLFCRAYINFINEDDIYIFRDKFDDYIFLDDKGVEYPAIVEYAPFQRMPKKRRKKDLKCGTLESDPMYLEFLETLKETDSDSREPKMEYSYQPTEEKKETSTPLLEFLAARKLNEKRRKEEKQRRRPRNRNLKDDENYDDDVKRIKPRDNEDDIADNNDRDDDDMVDEEIIKETQFVGKGRPKSFREQRKLIEEQRKKSDYVKKDKVKDNNDGEEGEKVFRKTKKEFQRDNFKERNRDKDKFHDKKDRSKFIDKKHETSSTKNDGKTDHPINKVADKALPIAKVHLVSSKIKPFTQLPLLNMSELSKAFDEMDNRNKSESAKNSETKNTKKDIDTKEATDKTETKTNETQGKEDDSKHQRRNSLETKEKSKNVEPLKRHKSLDEKSEPADRNKENDSRTERRIRNKDRPSLIIYQPGMGKFSKQRIDREKDGNKSGDSSTKITSSNNSSSNSVNSQD